MATTQTLQRITLIAGEDFSSLQYTPVFLDTSDNTVKSATGATDVVIGIVQNAPGEGEAADVAIAGVSRLLAQDTITLGQLIAGDAKPATVETAIAVGTAAYGHSIGRALEAAASGEYFELLLMPMIYIDSIS